MTSPDGLDPDAPMARHYSPSGRPLTLAEWVVLMQSTERVVAVTYWSDGTRLSTVWLGIDHNFTGVGPPLIFESMTFDADTNPGDPLRYATLAQAWTGHGQLTATLNREHGEPGFTEVGVLGALVRGPHESSQG